MNVINRITVIQLTCVMSTKDIHYEKIDDYVRVR